MGEDSLPSVWSWLSCREHGMRARAFCRRMQYHRLARLKADGTRRLQSKAEAGITCLAIENTEGRFALASSQDGALQCFDLFTTHAPSFQTPILHLPKGTPGGHTASTTAVDWYPSDTGAFLSCSKDRTAKLWDPNTASLVATFPTAASALTLRMAPSTHPVAAIGCADGCIRLLDVSSGVVCSNLMGYSGGVLSVAWCRVHEHQLIGGDAAGELRLWDVRRAGTLHAFDQADVEDTWARAVAGSNDDHESAVPGGHGILSTEAAGARAHDRAVTGVLQTPDGSAWVSSGCDNAIRVWDVETRRNLLRHFPEAFNSAGASRQLAIDESGQVLYFPSGSIITAYDVSSGQRCAELRGHMATVNAVAWSERLGSLATGSTDRQLLLWSVPEASEDMCIGGGVGGGDADVDAWSDDEAVGAAGGGREGGVWESGAVFSGGRSVAARRSAVSVETGRQLQREAEEGIRERQRGRAGHKGGRRTLGVSAGGVGAGREGVRRADFASERVKRVAAKLVRALLKHQPGEGQGHSRQ